jgi:hypothetical protein
MKSSTVSLEASRLVILINAEKSTVIGIDPTLIRVDQSEQTVPLESIAFTKTVDFSERPIKYSRLIEVNTGHLEVHALLKLKNKSDVHVQLPPATVNGSTLNFPEISFRLERNARLMLIMGNC